MESQFDVLDWNLKKRIPQSQKFNTEQNIKPTRSKIESQSKFCLNHHLPLKGGNLSYGFCLVRNPADHSYSVVSSNLTEHFGLVTLGYALQMTTNELYFHIYFWARVNVSTFFYNFKSVFCSTFSFMTLLNRRDAERGSLYSKIKNISMRVTTRI